MPATTKAVVAEIETSQGPARAHLRLAADPVGALVLGHGAGGGVEAPDLVVAADVAVELGLSVGLVEQPYKVAGKRSQPAAPKLDEAWLSVIESLRSDQLAGPSLVVGGRSAGARVACRTVAASDAVAVLCLAFPQHPPGKPEKSRQAELDAVRLPTLVIQGESDPFGMPPAAANRQVVTVRGNHSLKAGLDAVETAIRDWLPGAVG